MLQELKAVPRPANPSVSVIIPTYNRKDSLLLTLDSLSRQTFPADRFEAIVVDDGGTDGTERVEHSPYPFSLVYRRQINQGSAAARNNGAEQSSGEILIFIDDDMTLEPTYLAALINKTDSGTITMGLWQPYTPPNASVYAISLARQIAAKDARTIDDEEVPFTECTSNNLAVRREDFVRSGFWQDVLGDGPTLWGDVEFGYRAWKKGCRFVRVADAKIIHRDQHITSLTAATQRAYHVSKIVQPLFALHPEIQKWLPMFRDKNPIAWRNDPPRLILRKLARQLASSQPVMWAMRTSLPFVERCASDSVFLVLLYRWILSGYIYRGYRDGLRGIERSRPSLQQ